MNRLVNIDIIKFLSIIIMVTDHMILVLMDVQLNALQTLFFSFVPLCQMGFLMSSGYLMAYSFNKEKFNKYIFRIALFVILFVLMTILSNEQIIASGSILLNFALSTAISLFFLYRNKIRDLISFMAILFGLNIVFQILTANGIRVLNDVMANYPYPVNSYSLYFFLGIILFFYRDKIKHIFTNSLAKWLVIILLILYPFIFAYGIFVNDYSYYQHLPILLLASGFIGIYFFYTWEKIKLPKIIHQGIIKIADALLYIYVIHYIILFGYLKGMNLNWWQLSIAVIIIILLSIGIRQFVSYLRASSKRLAKT
ncbi:hypothetical protein ISR92_02250 [Patescibacteria group bacterium]|nr:hypothetical protein [Patescibacteria group bacterium]